MGKPRLQTIPHEPLCPGGITRIGCIAGGLGNPLRTLLFCISLLTCTPRDTLGSLSEQPARGDLVLKQQLVRQVGGGGVE